MSSAQRGFSEFQFQNEIEENGEEMKQSYLFSAFDFSLSSQALISDNLFSVATFARTASEQLN